MPETTLHGPRWFIATVPNKKKAIDAVKAAQEFLDATLEDRGITRKFRVEYRFVKRGEYVLEMVEDNGDN